jgi:hypothetical protein
MGSAAAVALPPPTVTVEERLASIMQLEEGHECSVDVVGKALSLQSFALVALIDECVERLNLTNDPLIADMSDLEGDPQLRIIEVDAAAFDADGQYRGEMIQDDKDSKFAVYALRSCQ